MNFDNRNTKHTLFQFTAEELRTGNVACSVEILRQLCLKAGMVEVDVHGQALSRKCDLTTPVYVEVKACGNPPPYEFCRAPDEGMHP